MEIAASWTEQMGFPLLKVEAAGAGKAKVTQSWFLADGSKVEPAEAKKWTVPIFATSKSSKGKKAAVQIFSSESFEVEVAGAGAGEWIQINAGYLTPARVLYSAELFSKLIDGVR